MNQNQALQRFELSRRKAKLVAASLRTAQ